MQHALVAKSVNRYTSPGRMTVPTQSRVRTFTYGSNMLSARMRTRVPSAKAVGIGHLPAHVLKWHKRSHDGSGKCDIEKSGRNEDVVWGVLFELEALEKPALDRAEGLGNGYVERRVGVVTDRGIVRASAYVATARDPALRPYHWYKAFVVAGAREHGLPQEYIQLLETTPSNRDPDTARTVESENLLTASYASHQH